MVTSLSFSEVGGHRVNEDAMAVQQHPADPNLWVCVIADGQGGQAGGGPASQLACETMMAAATGKALLQFPTEQFTGAQRHEIGTGER